MSEYELLESENAELKQKIMELEQKMCKLCSPLSKGEAKLLGTIHKCKIELKKQPLKKTGYNNHNKYSYFELSDFLPCLEVILRKHGLGSYCYFENGTGYLVIFDCVTGDFHSWDTPCRLPKVKENGFDVGVYMKAEQAVQTYARRTLYLQAFDIVEPNSIESDGHAKPKQSPKQTKPEVVEKKVEQKPPNNTSEERVKEILDQAYQSVTIDQGKEFHLGTALWTLKKLCENDDELEAVKEALSTYTADKIRGE